MVLFCVVCYIRKNPPPAGSAGWPHSLGRPTLCPMAHGAEERAEECKGELKKELTKCKAVTRRMEKLLQRSSGI